MSQAGARAARPLAGICAERLRERRSGGRDAWAHVGLTHPARTSALSPREGVHFSLILFLGAAHRGKVQFSHAPRSRRISGVWPKLVCSVPQALLTEPPSSEPTAILAAAREASAFEPTEEVRARVLRAIRQKVIRHERLAWALRGAGIAMLVLALALALFQANGP